MSASSLLQRLAAAAPILLPLLIDAAIKGAAILALTALATLAMRRASAAARHLVWFLCTLSLLILPILSAALPGWYILPRWAINAPIPPQPAAVPTAAPTPAPLPALSPLPLLETPLLPVDPPPEPAVAPLQTPPSLSASSPQAAAPEPMRPPWQAWGLLAWLAGTALLLGHISLGFLSLRLLQHGSSRITAGSWPILLRQLCVHLGIRRPVILLSSPRRTMPMTWGLWRTRLLLPEDFVTWTADQRRTVLLHELAHARRWDCLTQLIVQIACALHWFNPLVWLAWRRVQTERERACDDLVLSTGAKASAYAEQLLHIASQMPAVRFSAAAIAMARPSKLEGRLLAILDVKRNRRTLTWSAGLLAVLLIGALAVPLAMVRAGDAKPDVAPASPALRPAAESPPHSDVAPTLRFLAYQDDGPQPQQPLTIWRPGGELLAAGDADRRLADSHYPVRIGKSPRDGRVLYLWFSHPQFDQQSVSQVRFLNAAGEELTNAGATVGSRAESPADDAAKLGWVLYSTSPLPPGENLPDSFQLELRYSAGEWKAGHVFASDYHGATTIADGAMVNTVGQTAGGRAFIVITRDPTQSRDTQYDFTATTRDKKRLDTHLVSHSGIRNVQTDQYEFDTPLTQVQSFELRERPIRTILFKDISTRPGHLTSPATMPASQPATQPAAAKPASVGYFGGIVNPDSDPDLAKALEYDSECNGGKHLDNAQALAEKHYFAYLTRATDSANRARVYVQLGVLFATNYHSEKGEKPDFEKSVSYMRKALAEEPRRIDNAMIRARMFMVTPLLSSQEQLLIRTENLRWLQSLDEPTVRELWLPTLGRKPSDDVVRAFTRFLDNVREAETYNVAALRKSMRLPATQPARGGEQVQRDSLQLIEEMADTLKGVTDEQSAEAAAPKIEGFRERMRQLRSATTRPAAGPAPDPALAQKLQAQTQQATARFIAELRRIQQQADLWRILRDPVQRLEIDDPASPRNLLQTWQRIAQRQDPEMRQRALDEARAKLGQGPSAKREALVALLRAADVPFDRAPFLEPVRGLLADPDPPVRGAAVSLLGAIGAANDVPAVAALARDPDATVRAATPSALVQLDKGKHREAVDSAIGRLLDDPAEPVRRATVRSLWGRPTPEAVERQLLQLADDPSLGYDVLYYALSTRPLLRLAVAKKLIEVLDDPKSANPGRAAWGLNRPPPLALADDAKDLVRDALIRNVDATMDPYIRQQCIAGLGTVGDEKAVEKLKQIAANDESKKAREQANDALDRLNR